jgi:hypothetical protein
MKKIIFLAAFCLITSACSNTSGGKGEKEAGPHNQPPGNQSRCPINGLSASSNLDIAIAFNRWRISDNPTDEQLASVLECLK